MSEDELITLMELLRKYETEKVDPCIKRGTGNKLELMASFNASVHKKVINEICDCIICDL